MLKNISTSQVVGLALVALAVRWLARGIYRVYFHPLSRFPGPKLSAFTRFPHHRAVGKGKLPQYVAKLHEQYGEVVRISPDELSFLHANAWRDIHGHGPKESKGSAPPKNFHRYTKPWNGVSHLITIEDPAEHAATRKIFTTAFSDRALMQQAPLFTKYADKLVACLQKGGTFDLVSMYNFTTFDVMSNLAFGESLHMLEQGAYNPWVSIIFQNIRISVLLGRIYFYYPLATYLIRRLLHKRIATAQQAHFNFSSSRVTKRLEKGRQSDGVDLWDLILQQEEKGGKSVLTRGQMDANSGLFMVAGTETTATLLAGLTFMLLKHPDKMDKLKEEVRATFTSSDEITMEVLQAMPYLNACIKEALRKYPPVPVGMPHLTPREGSTVCGYFVPPGITVSAPHLAIYTSSRMFTDPLSFIPERWIGDSRYANDERAVLQPFSYGARDCLGKNMAYHEMRLILAKVVFNFDLELMPENGDWFDQEVFTLWQKKPLMVDVRPVKSA
ncbi:cytochrome P450 [Setomelanomma holmii]|uniref:Cytochrome P450 n=1 Tax=Setomelanomma holmii TaxID=210430 RepID=A0A9P4HHF9_9PLEO|nr:cytochrome P450 [Setomelanomma holmii]